MFKEMIQTTPFCEDSVASMFDFVSGNSFRGDCSLTSTLRALLINRNHTNGIRIKISQIYTDSDSGSEVARDIERYIDRKRGDGKSILLVCNVFGYSEEDTSRVFANIDSSLKRVEGVERFEKVETFFHKSFRVICYRHEETHGVYFFVENLDLRKYHYLQMAIVPSMPWFFKENGLDDDELALVYSLKEQTKEPYMNAIGNLSNKLDLRSMRIKSILEGFESRCVDSQISSLKSRISDFDYQISEHLDSVDRLMADRNENCLILSGLMNGDRTENVLMDYFLCNKKLNIIQSDGDQIVYSVNDYISYFDEEVAEVAIRNHRSCIYRSRGDETYMAEREALYRSVFVDRDVKIRVSAGYSLRLSSGVRAYTLAGTVDEENHRIYNPHINTFECLGNYTRIFNDCIKKADYIGAIEQTIASAKSLNWTDSTVIGDFAYTVDNSDVPFFELPDGSVKNRNGVIEWLRENGKITE